MASQTQNTPPDPPRLSRYRSQRKAMAQHQPSPAPAVPPVPPMPSEPLEDQLGEEEQQQQEVTKQTIQRSMSRYRNARLPASLVTAPPLPQMPTNGVPGQFSTNLNTTAPHHSTRRGKGATPRQQQPAAPPERADGKASRYYSSDIMKARTPREPADPRKLRHDNPENSREEARQLLDIEQQRQRRMKEKLNAQRQRIAAGDEVDQRTAKHNESRLEEDAQGLEEANRRYEELKLREREQAEEAEKLRKQKKYEMARAKAKRDSLLRKQQDTDLNEKERRDRDIRHGQENLLLQLKKQEAAERNRELSEQRQQRQVRKDSGRSQAEEFERRRKQKIADMERQLVENEKAAEKERQDQEQRRRDENMKAKERKQDAADEKLFIKKQVEMEKQREKNERMRERRLKEQDAQNQEKQTRERKKAEQLQADQERTNKEQVTEETSTVTKGSEPGKKDNSSPPPVPPPPIPDPPLEEFKRGESIRRKLSVMRPSTSRAASKPLVLEDGIAMPRPSTSKEKLSGLLKKKRPEETAENAMSQTTKERATIPEDAPLNNKLAGGNGPPGADAPISASNAGERRVKIECGKSMINLPVNPTTTPVDILRSASVILSESVNPKCSLLIEEFGKVGVQRPLRKYEYIRDVMNSWDYDAQHAFVIIPQAGGFDNPDLEVANVPDEQPSPFSCTMMYSQRPGKWEARYVTLRADGQMVQAKKEGAPETNVCHLSDFDIYQPMAKQNTTKIKPPKKHCFAIKSLQKSSMFMSTEMFVHFFCTGDKRLGGEFYSAVQKWRSWYLVNVLGEGQVKKKKGDHNALSEGLSGKRQTPGSRDSHYQLGSFQPLLDLDIFNTTGDTADLKSSGGTATHSRNISQLSKGGPPSSFSRWFTESDSTTHQRGHSVTQSSHSRDDDNAFAPTGLLGRSYSQRQKVQADRELAAKNDGPFTAGPSLLNKGFEQSRPSMDQGRPSLDLRRGPSVRKPGMPKPLVDFTSGFDETPVEKKKGKGFIPDSVGPGGLIGSATSPEHAVMIPQANESGLFKSRSGHRAVDSNGQLVWDKDDPAQQSLFLQDGLLAHSQPGVGTGTKGKGVMTGYGNAKSPMIDMNERSQYAVGSLLEKVEKSEGGPGPKAPIISRAKGEEVDVETGEGL